MPLNIVLWIERRSRFHYPEFVPETQDTPLRMGHIENMTKADSMNSCKQSWLMIFLLIVFALTFNRVNAQGYHNSTRKFTDPQKVSESDWSDPVEMKRTWNAAIVRIPDGGSGMIKTSIHKIEEAIIPQDKKFPTIIYLHGCSGVWKGTYQRIDFLARNGFAVIAPISFARKKYPKSCNVKKHQGGLYRPTLKMRQNDAGYAISQAKKLSWVDVNNVFLMGLSQGGITTATFYSDDPAASVNARVVEGWTCHAGWKEYRGINAPANEPVLTLVGENDPWFQKRWNRGDCGEFLNKNNGSISIVYKTGKLRNRHELFESKQAQQTVLKFLRKHIRK